jgi:hypothetical protein
MTTLYFGRSLLHVCTIAAVLSGCSSGQAGGPNPAAPSVARETFKPSATPGPLKFYAAVAASPIVGGNMLLGPDGNFWYPSDKSGSYTNISSFGPSGEATYALPPACPSCESAPWPIDLVNGPDGRIWFGTEAGVIGAITTGGTVQYYNGPLTCNAYSPCPIELGAVVGENIWLWFDTGQGSQPYNVGYFNVYTGQYSTVPVGGTDDYASESQIVEGPDGNMWFCLGRHIGRVTPELTDATIFPIKPAFFAVDILSGPDGDLWFSGQGSYVGRMNTSGQMQSETDITRTADQMLVGPDDDVWISRHGALLQMTSPQTFNTIKVPGRYKSCVPAGLATDQSGNLWFSSFDQTGTYGLCSYGIGEVLPN